MLKKYTLKEIEKIKEKIKNKKVLLQVPEGLKYQVLEIIDYLEKIGCEVIFSGEPCYGACDIRENDALLLGCDLILHLGHKEFYKKTNTKIPIIFIPIYLEVEYNPKEFEKIKEKRVGLISSVQHTKMLRKIKEDLKKIGKRAIIGNEILGCWTENAKRISNKVDCFLLVGSGRFHALALENLEKPIYILDLERSEVTKLEEKENREIKNVIRFEKFKEAESVGILLSSKPGQFFREIENVKDIVKKFNKRAYVIILDRITQENLEGLKIDFFINTACPRIIEDYFKKPMMNVNDFLNLAVKEVESKSN